jgi:methyltransferase OMS1
MLVYKSKQDSKKEVERRESGEEQVELTPGNFDTSTIWNKIASDYDKEISTDEFWMGIGLLRRWLIGKAKVNDWLPSRIGKSPCNSGSELMMKRIF